MAHESDSLSDLHALLRQLSPPQIREAIQELDPEDAEQILFDWRLWARPNQLTPAGGWSTWMLLAGRGFGKTRTGAEFIREEVHKTGRVALIAPTAADARDVMVEGESGILAISPPWDRPKYEPSKRRVTWPDGALATLYSADEPERLRGPQHGAAWADELCAWRYAQEAWDMLMFGLRLGANPRSVATTTPKPTRLLKDLLADPLTHITRGSTYDNKLNLAPTFLKKIVAKYEGTRLGRQELNAEILEDTPGALWTRTQIEDLRVTSIPNLIRIVVAVDPAATSSDPESAETGIIVAGLGENGHAYILDDVSLQGSPAGWGAEAVAAYHKFKADRMIGEANNGGEMVMHVIHSVDGTIPFKLVWASRNKHTRAEPISSYYERKVVHHVGAFGILEDQMCTWVPGMKSPDRMDALVWALTELLIEPEAEGEHEEVVVYDERVSISDF